MPHSDLRGEIYSPLKHHEILNNYMASTTVENNKSPKALRLSEYDNNNGVLLLVLDLSDKIQALSSVLVEENQFHIKCAKIYGRFHIVEGCSHTVIDRFLEPLTFNWCLEREITNIFLTINEGNLHVLDWACRRMGERRNVFRANRHFPELGSEIRRGFAPYQNLIYERNCWQYAIFYSENGKWFLERETKPLSPEALSIFQREFPHATQDWL